MSAHWRAAALLAVASLGWSCAGDGTGLDEFGNPLGSTPALGPTLTSIQANIFTPICTQCHTGAAGPLGLALDEGAAHGNLVGVESAEVDLLLVAPNDPEASYLLWKIEGRSGIAGARMPFNLQPLSSDQIEAIRSWILGGAEND